jgi:hypothetical protein
MGNWIWCQLLIIISFSANVNNFGYQMPVIDQYIKQLIISEKNRNIEHY